MLKLWRTEPAAIIGLVTAGIDVAVAIGVPVSIELRTAIVGLVTAFGALLTRSQVTPATSAPVAATHRTRATKR